MKAMQSLIICLSAFGLLTTCSLTGTIQNPIFSNTKLVSATTPKGTLAFSSSTTFTWQSPGTAVTYEVVGIFTNPIVVSGMQIQNSSDCIAMWTTGMSGSAGSVEFSQFKQFSGGAIQSGGAVLYANLTNYWAVWCYGSDMKISHSSAQIVFLTN